MGTTLTMLLPIIYCHENEFLLFFKVFRKNCGTQYELIKIKLMYSNIILYLRLQSKDENMRNMATMDNVNPEANIELL